MLRETQSVRHLDLPDALTAEVIESRLIASILPRYNRAGKRVEKYCYVRLDIDTPWPRLSIVKDPARTGLHLGPLPSRTMAGLVIEAIQTAIPLRRCSARLGRTFTASPDATECSAAQLGVAHCPCSGSVPATEYQRAVADARRCFEGDASLVSERLTERMRTLAAQQRFEEAAAARDRLSAFEGALKRRRLVEALRHAGRVRVELGDSWWIIEHASLVDGGRRGHAGHALPIAAPAAIGPDGPVPRRAIDEALLLARFCEARAGEFDVSATGDWRFPTVLDPSSAATVPLRKF